MAVPTLERLNTAALRDTVRTFRDTVREHARGFNRLNVYPVPDGDTGTNMARTLDAVVAEMDTAADDDHDATCDAISHGSLMGARGNSGVILSQIMRGFAGTVKEHADVQGAKFAEALQAAADRRLRGGAQADRGHDPHGGPRERRGGEGRRRRGRVAGRGRCGRLEPPASIALDNTPEQLPVLKDAGVVDAGGAGFLLLLDSVLYVVDGEPLPVAEPDDGTAGAVGGGIRRWSHTATPPTPGELDVSEQRYEVMYFLDLADERIRDFKERWGAIGDSIVVVGGDGLWNCHVHTNDIGAAIEVALDLGGPTEVRSGSPTCSKRSTRSTQRREAELASTAHDAPVRRGVACGHHRRRRGLHGRAASSSCSPSSACKGWSPAARR